MKFLALLFVVAVVFAEITEEDMVLVLNDTNFDEAIALHENLLVEFYAPWCGHCKKLAPEYAAAAKKLRTENPPMYIAKVDSTISTELAKKHGIRGFPTLKFFKSGIPSDYEAGRTTADIVAFMKKKSGPVAVTFTTIEALKATIDAEETAIVGYFKSSDSAAYKAWYEIVASLEDAKCIYITDAAVTAKMNAKEDSIYLYKTTKAVLMFEGDVSKDLKKWIALNELPLVIPFSQKYSRKLFNPEHGINTQLMYFAPEKEPGAIKKVMENVASKFMGKTFVVHVPSENNRLMEYFGLTADQIPAVVMTDFSDGGMKKFKFNDDKSEAVIINFVNDYFAGKLSAYLKSELIPEVNDGPVVKLVGKNFEQIVYESGKNVMVKFYAPWCGHCKQLAPIYEKLGEHYASFKNVVIAEMDSTQNEVDGIEVRGFPTIKFWVAGGKASEPIEFDGERNFDAMVEFIDKHIVPVQNEEQDL